MSGITNEIYRGAWKRLYCPLQERLAAEGLHTPPWALEAYMDIAGKGSHPNDTRPASRPVFLDKKAFAPVKSAPAAKL